MTSKTDMSKILVVDIESTCWDTNDTEYMKANSEVIEIGYALIDRNEREIVEHSSIFVLPQISEINEFCTNLTGITQEFLESNNAVSFAEACSILRKNFKDIAWASYGDYDRIHFYERQCPREGVAYPFNRTHYNIKHLAAWWIGLEKQVGLETALEKFSMKFIGRQHSGADDAYNAARLFRTFL